MLIKKVSDFEQSKIELEKEIEKVQKQLNNIIENKTNLKKILEIKTLKFGETSKKIKDNK